MQPKDARPTWTTRPWSDPHNLPRPNALTLPQARRYKRLNDTGTESRKMDRNQALALYRQMLLIRRFEERCAQLYVEGKIGGVPHPYIRPGTARGGGLSHT